MSCKERRTPDHRSRGDEPMRRAAIAEEEVIPVPAHGVVLAGDLYVPEDPVGLVLFAHDAGGNRWNPHNRKVAAGLHAEGLATLRPDLLTPGENADPEIAPDVPRLDRRLAAATRWALDHPVLEELPLGYFGVGAGAATALRAAADFGPAVVRAIVSCGGRPDPAGETLERFRVPTLLIVGGNDADALTLNREALRRLGGGSALEIVAGASPGFEEPGALEEVGRLAVGWFLRHLAGVTRTAAVPAEGRRRK